MKHKRCKRILSTLLAMVMLIGLLPTAAMAAIRDPIVEIPTTLSFKTEPQSGSALKKEGYAYTWALNKAADMVVLEIKETNRLTGASSWEQLATLTGTSGSGSLTYPVIENRRPNDQSVYRISAIVAGKTLEDSELASCTFTVTWMGLQTFAVTVKDGTGSGEYTPGASVTVTADQSGEGWRFLKWSGLEGLTITNGSATTETVTFTMPLQAVELTAVYQRIAQDPTPVRPAKGDGTEGNPFQITNIGELYWFAGFVNKTVTDPDLTVEPKVACAELMNDITVNYRLLTEDGALNGTSGVVEWIPIGLTAGYDGTFDGNGKTISGIYCAPQDATKNFYGFFSHIDEGCVRNLTLVDSYFCAPAKNTAYTGGIAGQVYYNGTVQNCHFDGTVTTAITGDSENKENYTYLKIAGIAGSVLGEVRDCTVRGLISGYGRLVGGIAAYVNYGEVIGCVNEATVENTRSDTGYYYTGGIAAAIAQGTVRDCCNKSYVSSGWVSAGIVCHVEDKGSTVSRCWNEGEIKNGSGIVCLLKGTVQNCYNTGKVECGIVGQPNSGSSITYCHNVGEIPSYGSPIWNVFSSDVEIAGCYYMADSETDEYDGTTYKTAAEFADGTVLALLDNGNWEQGDDYPVLAKAKGVTVSGTVTGSNSDTDEVTVQLIPDGSSEVAYETVVKGNATSYSLSGVADGRYTLKVQAEGGRVRCYEITVAGESVCQDVSVVEYTVTFQNWDGSVITTATYFDGETVEVPADPVRQKDNTYTYTFSGWDKEVVACAGNAIYRATYTSEYIEYTVVFMDADGKQLSKATYHYGDTVVAPEAPSKEADSTYTYTFSGWDQEVVPCTKDAVYTAVFTAHVRGVRVSGTVTGFGSDTDEITVALFAEGSETAAYTAKVKGNTGAYAIEGVAEGTYTLTVSKPNHVTREYTVTVEGEDTVVDAKLQPVGDVTGDGKVNIMDVAKLYAHVKGASILTDEYTLACGDVNTDQRVNIMDVVRLYAHVKGMSPLY